jgi:hypothetical protein
MAAMSTGTMLIASADNATFAGSKVGDLVLRTGAASQRILLGAPTPGDASAKAAVAVTNNSVVLSGHLLPSADVQYDIGTPDLRFRSLYVSGNTIFIGSNSLSTDSESGAMKIVNTETDAPVRMRMDDIQIGSGDSTIVLRADPITNRLIVDAPGMVLSNVTITGKLTVPTANVAQLNVATTSNLTVDGPTSLLDVVGVHGAATLYGAGSTVAFSNAAGGYAFLSGGLSNYLGVGVASPTCALDVGGRLRVADAVSIGGAATGAFPLDVPSANAAGVSVNCSAKVLASEFTVYSDARLKTELQYRDSREYLDMLDRLRVCEYEYVDKGEKGGRRRIGFIAQEVERVAPMCVDTMTGWLPDVCSLFSVLPAAPGASLEEVTVASSAGAAELLAAGDRVRCRAGGVTFAATVSAGADAGSVKLRPDAGAPLLDAGVGVFVVGRRVDDLKVLNGDQLSGIAIGAIQALRAELLQLRQQIR